MSAFRPKVPAQRRPPDDDLRPYVVREYCTACPWEAHHLLLAAPSAVLVDLDEPQRHRYAVCPGCGERRFYAVSRWVAMPETYTAP